MDTEEVKPLRGYSEEPIFYVYVHKKPGTNEEIKKEIMNRLDKLCAKT